jgi:hypothetical protein
MRVNFRVTVSTKSYEIVLLVVSEPATGLNMMHLEFMHRSAALAAPAISLQYFLSQFVVRDWVQS